MQVKDDHRKQVLLAVMKHLKDYEAISDTFGDSNTVGQRVVNATSFTQFKYQG